MGSDSQSATQTPSVVDATSNTFVLAFELVDSQIQNLPSELERALQDPAVAAAIKSVLTDFALAKQKTGSTTVSDDEASKLAKALLDKAGGKVEDSLLDQVKKTSDYKKLEQSVSDLEKALKAAPVGVWVDKNKGILYVVGASLVLGGATALYVTKTGGPVVDFTMSKLTGKSVQVFQVGRFSLSGQLLKFEPATRTVGGALTGNEKWERLQVSVQLGVIATGSDVKEVNGKVIFKTQDINLSISGTDQPTQKTINLGLGLDIKGPGLPGPLTIGLGVVVKDGKADQGQLNAAMKTPAGNFGLTGSAGKSEQKVLATWSLNF
jgi:hypothetical protein